VLSHAAALGGSDEEALIATRRQIDHCVRLGGDWGAGRHGPPLSDSDDRYFQLTRGAADHAVITG
jgi:hypothetical protein